jgi:hypothetical protein
MPPEQFRRLLRDSSNPAGDSGETREAYRYAKVSGPYLGFYWNPNLIAIVTEIRDARAT